ncbi:MAG: hypothetical protein JWO28_2999 [Hyphomicrobiales bacterium]|jgi:hypothetical protein|nr:hypothetical protein [Hyphomicrobiales bacterium]
MTRFLTVSLFCTAILAGIALAALTPRTGEVEAREGQTRCQQIQVSVDEGYGISAVETRQVCRPS